MTDELHPTTKQQRSGFLARPQASPDWLSRMAVVTSHFPPSTGGLERHVAALAEVMANRGIAVDVIAPRTTTVMQESYSHPGITVRRFPNVVGGSRYSVSPSLWGYMRRAANTYDLVHLHNYHALPFLTGVFARARTLVVTPHYHGTAHSRPGKILSAPYRRAGRIIFNRADAVICVSNAEAGLLATHFPGTAAKINVIHNGIDVEALRGARPLAGNGHLILTAGRLERYKRVERIFEAMRFLGPEWRLCVIGQGRDRGRLERRACGSGLAGRVSFVDPVSDELFRSWLKTAAVYVSMSAHEAFGLAVAEAITAGAGAVASDIPPHREVVTLLGPKSFALVAGDSSPIRLAQAILRTGRQPAEAAEAERWSWERMAEATFEVYRTAVFGGVPRDDSRSTAAEELGRLIPDQVGHSRR